VVNTSHLVKDGFVVVAAIVRYVLTGVFSISQGLVPMVGVLTASHYTTILDLGAVLPVVQ
jgi:hypothetical protein